MKKYLSGTRYAAIAGAAMLLSFAATPAEAQAPGGSYLQSCRDVRAHGDTLSAVCRQAGGGWARTTLRDVDRCAGGVANADGRLTCNQGRHSGSSGPPQRERDHRRDGYGSSYRPGQPSYGPGHSPYGQGHRYGDRDWYGR